MHRSDYVNSRAHDEQSEDREHHGHTEQPLDNGSDYADYTQ